MSNDGLVVGNWYWVRSKGGVLLQNGRTTDPGEWMASVVKGGVWKSIMNGMWCDPANDQALSHYEIVGPIPMPDYPDTTHP